MHPKLRCFIHLSIALALSLAAVRVAPAQASASTGTTATVGGQSSDPSAVTSAPAPASGSSLSSEQPGVTVAHASSTVNQGTGSQAHAFVSKDKQNDAQPEDPAELARELSVLAGHSVGPDGGLIFIGAASL